MSKKLDTQYYLFPGSAQLMIGIILLMLFIDYKSKNLGNLDPFGFISEFINLLLCPILICSGLFNLFKVALISFYNNDLLPSLEQEYDSCSCRNNAGCHCGKDNDPTIPELPPRRRRT